MTTNIDENIKSFRQIYADCSDIKMQEMYLGRDASIKCFVAYIEVTCAGSGINNSAFGRFTSYLEGIDRDQVKEVLDKNQAALSEFAHLHTVKEAAQMMLTGDVIFFVDGYPDAFKLPDKGYPAMSIQEIDSEKVIRGSNEGFADSIKINTALIRRRLRSTRLKCKEVKKGLRGHSNVDILYVRDLVKPGLVEEVEKNLDSYVIDHVGDSGVLEQFAEAKWYSPFPQLQTTKRPDVAVNALLEGRVVVLCDNSPIAVILPTTMNNFLKTADDYYNRTIAATVARTYRKAIDDYMEAPEKYKANMSWYQEQISNCTYRQFTTGFFYGKPDEHTQIYDNNTYVKEYTYLGYAEEVDENGFAHITQRNKFTVGEMIEIMKPDGRNITATVRAIYDEDGNSVESAPHPQQKLAVDLGTEIEKYDLLRRAEA